MVQTLLDELACPLTADMHNPADVSEGIRAAVFDTVVEPHGKRLARRKVVEDLFQFVVEQKAQRLPLR